MRGGYPEGGYHHRWRVIGVQLKDNLSPAYKSFVSILTMQSYNLQKYLINPGVCWMKCLWGVRNWGSQVRAPTRRTLGTQTWSFERTFLFNLQWSNKTNSQQSNKISPHWKTSFFTIKWPKLKPLVFSSHRYGGKLRHLNCNKIQTPLTIVFLSTSRLQEFDGELNTTKITQNAKPITTSFFANFTTIYVD